MGMFRVEYLLLGILVIGVRSRDIPNCDFFDTVQLRESEKLCNGSYRYEDVVIPAKLTGKYDYEIDYDGDRVSVPKHIRGCVCKLKTCIRFCCHHKKLMAGNLCSQDVYENLTYEYTLDITQLNGSVIKKHVLNDMVVQQDLPLPCERHYSLDAETSTYDMWSLYEVGYSKHQILSIIIFNTLEPILSEWIVIPALRSAISFKAGVLPAAQSDKYR